MKPTPSPPPPEKHWRTVRRGGKTIRVAVVIKRDEKNPPKQKGR